MRQYWAFGFSATNRISLLREFSTPIIYIMLNRRTGLFDFFLPCFPDVIHGALTDKKYHIYRCDRFAFDNAYSSRLTSISRVNTLYEELLRKMKGDNSLFDDSVRPTCFFIEKYLRQEPPSPI